MTLTDKLREVSALLASKGVEDAAKEAEMLITEALCISRSELYSCDLEISDETSGHIDSLASRRAEGEPIQYIIGHVDFYGLKINVGKGVLIPRPETELLVEETIKQLKKRFMVHGSRFTVLDLCTGSGCIALCIAKHLPDADVFGTDISEEALKYARDNADLNRIENVTFLQGDLYEPVKGMRFDIIVANPPYIRRMDIRDLQPEINLWEPVEALDGGEDGLQFYREILCSSANYLSDGGLVIMEVGSGEAKDVLSIAEGLGLRCASIVRDYSGIERVLSFHVEQRRVQPPSGARWRRSGRQRMVGQVRSTMLYAPPL